MPLPFIDPVTNPIMSILKISSERPVFKVTLTQPLPAQEIVVKGEKGADAHAKKIDLETSIVWSSKLMKNVDNRLVNTKIMNHNEVTEFKNFVIATCAPNSPEVNDISQNQTWVKMPLVPGVTKLDDFIGTVNDQYISTPKKVKERLIEFLHPTTWYRLGKITAVDIFNGNEDRFNLKGGLANAGNFMLMPNPGMGLQFYTVIGLDTFHGQNWQLNNPNLNQNIHTPAELSLLNDRTATGPMFNFAVTCVSSVAREFKNLIGKYLGGYQMALPTNDGNIIKLDICETMFDIYISDFMKGLTDGSDGLKKYLKDKQVKYSRTNFAALGRSRRAGPPLPAQGPMKSLPPGVLARMTKLGW
jgi:hypothetical protein